MAKRMTKMEKIERIHEINGDLKRMNDVMEDVIEKKYKEPFRFKVGVPGDQYAFGIQPDDLSEATQVRLQKYYKRLVMDEMKSITTERDRLMRNLK